MLSTPIFNVGAYDDETTHPALTQEIIKLFEFRYLDYKFSDQEKNSLEKGSIKEDSPKFRCINHFYDPVYEEGLYGNLSAKQWAKATKIQALLDLDYSSKLANISQDLFGSKTDFSFDRAVFEYVHGDNLRGLESLGHILHLIEDMAVPPHTRSDGHPTGSPYEEYAKQWVKENVNIADNLILDNEKIFIYENLDDYFYNLALFTNQNFFSKDTIFDKKYAEPTVIFKDTESIEGDYLVFGYKDKRLGKLLEINKKRSDKTGEIEILYSIEDDNQLIFTDYWNSLSKQAVLYGAGVIKLFFDAVEEEKITYELYKKNKSFFDVVVIGAVDVGKRVSNFFSSFIFYLKKGFASVDPNDLLADVNNSQEEEGGSSEEVVVFESPKPSPEDPGSPELMRLAFILKEAERMIASLEKDIANLNTPQELGGTGEELIIIVLEEEDQKEELIVPINYGGGGYTPPQQTSSNNPSSTTSVVNVVNPPTITSPVNFSQFATTTVTFSGSASSTQVISNNFTTATTTVLQNDTWELVLAGFSQGTTTIQFFASDGQTTSNAAEIEISVDTTVVIDPPSLEINQCGNSVLSSSCLVATTTLDIIWATTTPCTNFSHFNVENNGVFSTTLTTTTQVTNLADDSTYTFSVAVVDTDGNFSATTTETATIKTMPIVINEIAWAGTDASAYDEWIELYNRSTEDIDLDDWILYSQDGSPHISFSSATDKIIEAGSYYLIERQSGGEVNELTESSVVDVVADLWTSFGLGLNNSGEYLILAYKKSNQATTTVDTVSFSGGWPTGDGSRTLEKYNLDLSGSDTNNWALSIGQYILNGHDVNGTAIKGTPRARNSLNYKIAIGDTLDQDKTLTKGNSPYFVGNDGLTIDAGVTLTMGPEVVVKTVKRYGSAKLTVNGSIQANGEGGGKQVIFTIFSDDTGGDTNSDGVCISGTATSTCPGEVNNFWSQIIFNSLETSNFDNTIFRFGGSRLVSSQPEAMVVSNNTNVNFTNTNFEQSYKTGLHLTSATSTISNCNFNNNKKEAGNYGLYASNSGLDVQNSVFDNNQVGLGVYDSVGAVIDSNTFDNHSDFPIIISGSPNLNILDNTGTNNTVNGINIFGYITNQSAATTLSYNALPYVLDKPLVVSVETALTIGPKTTLKFDGGYLNASGYLNIDGGDNEADKILITSVGGSIIPQSGINLSSTTPSVKNTEFRYLDKALAFLNCNPVDLSLENVRFQDNTWSIYADNQNAQVSFADRLFFATTTPMSMNAAVHDVLQDAKNNGADIVW